MPLSYFPELQWLPYSPVLNTPSPSPPGTQRSREAVYVCIS